MFRNIRISIILWAMTATGSFAALSPAVPGGPQLSPPSPAVVHLAGRGYRAANVLVGGTRIHAPAFLRGDRAWLPARAILTRLGGSVEWVAAERAFYASFPAKNMVERIAVGSRDATVFRFDPAKPHLAGAKVRTERLPAAPFVAGARAYAPLRGLVEAIGGRLEYYPDSRSVYVTLPRRVGVPAP